MKKNILKLLALAGIAIAAVGCNDIDSDATVSSTSAPNTPCGDSSCITTISPETFVAELVKLAQNGDIAQGYANTTVIKDSSLQNGFFVIWDGNRNQPVAVSTSLLSEATSASDGNLYEDSAAFYFGNSNGPDNLAAETSLYYTGAYDWTYKAGVVLLTQLGTNTNGDPLFEDSNGLMFDAPAQTHDTSLQLSEADKQEVMKNAATLSLGMQMGYGPALKLSMINEQAKQIMAQRSVTAADRASLTAKILKVGNVTGDEINDAYIAGMKGDNSKENELLQKVTTSLNMRSDANLRSAFAKMGMPID